MGRTPSRLHARRRAAIAAHVAQERPQRPTPPTGAFHVRHGVYRDPILGYRAVREVDGKRHWLGPWTDEPTADDIARTHSQDLRDRLAAAGAPVHDGDTPLELWIPVTTPQGPQ